MELSTSQRRPAQELLKRGLLVGAALATVAVQLVTPEAERALDAAGLGARYRHHVGRSEPGTTGEMVYSRFPLDPLSAPAAVDDVTFAVAHLPGGDLLRIADVHVFGPQPGDSAVWVRTLHDLDHALGRTPGAWIALGDFNASSDHRTFRDLLHDGRRDAHQASGRGYARTWPAAKGVPPLLLIDHAIVSRDTRVATTREQTLAGSDHRMIRVTVTVRAD